MLRPLCRACRPCVRLKHTIAQPDPVHIEETEDDFDNVIGELHRRRKKMDAKRGRQGGDFVDFLKVTVRGGESLPRHS